GAKPLLRSELVLNYSLTVFMLLGLLLARRNHPMQAIPLINFIALFPAVYYITHSTSRYRHPIDPVIVLLAAYAAISMARYLDERIASIEAQRLPPGISFGIEEPSRYKPCFLA